MTTGASPAGTAWQRMMSPGSASATGSSLKSTSEAGERVSERSGERCAGED